MLLSGRWYAYPGATSILMFNSPGSTTNYAVQQQHTTSFQSSSYTDPTIVCLSGGVEGEDEHVGMISSVKCASWLFFSVIFRFLTSLMF